MTVQTDAYLWCWVSEIGTLVLYPTYTQNENTCTSYLHGFNP